jgi:hypothetical protein
MGRARSGRFPRGATRSFLSGLVWRFKAARCFRFIGSVVRVG